MKGSPFHSCSDCKYAQGDEADLACALGHFEFQSEGRPWNQGPAFYVRTNCKDFEDNLSPEIIADLERRIQERKRRESE